MLKEHLEKMVASALSEIGLMDMSFVVERPLSKEHGEYATNAAFIAAQTLKRDPVALAHTLVNILNEQKDPLVETAEVAGKGFINLTLSRRSIIEEIGQAAISDTWGRNLSCKDRTVMVEYTDPNPFKVFHIGHLMSNTIGESICRSLEYSGAKVVRANYQGDVGLHVARAIWEMKRSGMTRVTDIESVADAYVNGTKSYESDPKAKQEIDALNKNIYEKNDPEINALYESGRAISLAHFEELYAILGTKFDLYFFETETAPVGLSIVKQHPDIFTQSDGALVFHGEEYGLHTRVFVTGQDLPTYEAKELGLIELKQERSRFDLSITITGSEQKEYFKVVLCSAELVFPSLVGKFIHRTHGMMRFAASKMSSRVGNVITGESLIKDLKLAAQERMKERNIEGADMVSQQIAVGAIKYAVLRQGTGRDMIFDPEESLSFEGNSGPYLQYAHTRALSLIKNAIESGVMPNDSDASSTSNMLERTLIHFPEVVERSAKEFEPHHLVTYLTELSSEFNSWYANTRILGGEQPQYGVLLASAVERVLSQGLMVLGIPVPERM